jgi:TPR repeat protein
MSTDEEKQSALVLVQSTALTKAGAKSLAARGRHHLRDKEEAEEWLRKGLALQNDAPPSHWPPAPVNPYAAPQPAMSAELQRIKEQEEREQLRKRDEMLKVAFRCFESGHELDPINPELLYWLADSYYWGCGVQVDKEMAAALYRRAADRGHSNAQYCLGVLYSDGEGVDRDEVEAAAWHHKAAEQGNTDAQVSLGLAYKTGSGVPQDYAQGAMWLRRAGEKEDFGDQPKTQNSQIIAFESR